MTPTNRVEIMSFHVSLSFYGTTAPLAMGRLSGYESSCKVEVTSPNGRCKACVHLSTNMAKRHFVKQYDLVKIILSLINHMPNFFCKYSIEERIVKFGDGGYAAFCQP
jgi:hypothetical protein